MGSVVQEGGTCVIQVTFYDENDALVAPTAATWTLMNQGGTVINNRLDVAISPLTSTVAIVLGTNDLLISGGDNKRRLTVKATYNSSAGTGLALRSDIGFTITDIAGV